jgi:DNA-binding NarL/FixJ family response regulator
MLLWQGFSTAGVASRLFIGRPTVRSHIAALVHKLGVHDRAALLTLSGQPDAPAPQLTLFL